VSSFKVVASSKRSAITLIRKKQKQSIRLGSYAEELNWQHETTTVGSQNIEEHRMI